MQFGQKGNMLEDVDAEKIAAKDINITKVNQVSCIRIGKKQLNPTFNTCFLYKCFVEAFKINIYVNHNFKSLTIIKHL